MSDDIPMRAPRLARRLAAPAVALLLGLALLAGCGSDEAGGETAAAPDYKAAIADAPAPLAKLYAHGDAVLDGGEATYDRLLAGVRGYPAVVNNWASWCLPCRDEFPYFQELSAKYLDRVAFLGVDSEDSRSAAETFLRDHPLPYPSVEAPAKRDFQDWTGAELVGYPNTLYYDRRGELAYAKQGPYTDAADLRADIEKYALGG